MQRVRYVVYDKNDDGKYVTKEYQGTFLEFGTDYENFDSGIGIYSTAIIKKDDGFLVNINVEDVQFLD